MRKIGKTTSAEVFRHNFNITDFQYSLLPRQNCVLVLMVW